jgi:phosphatidylglycerol---prolipoprotein diacylglyceryl transferase
VIPDSHLPLLGLKPVLFSAFGLSITSYAVFMLLGILAAVGWHWHASRSSMELHQHSWTIILGALFFGSLGAKLMASILYVSEHGSFGFTQFLYSGRSIIGGLLGGWFGVKAVKRWFGITTRHGNTIAPAAALGIAIGRIGCFLGSCCYGQPIASRFGVDFGDGQLRHPTQLYEALFALALFFYLRWRSLGRPTPGILFKQFLIAYLSFRFLIEFIRIEPKICLGLSIYQVLSLLIVGLVCFQSFRHRSR